MNNLNTYYIPVEITNTQYLKVEAISELAAIRQVENTIHNNNLRQRNDIVKIVREGIECDQDEQMMFNLEDDGLLDTTIHTSSTKEVL